MNNFNISGKIGNKEIAREEINSFLSSVKEFEWTDNALYKPAKVVEVKPINISLKSNIREAGYQPKNINLDQFKIQENQRLADFQQYKADLEDRKNAQQEKITQKKQEFLNNFFPNEHVVTENSDKKEFLELIKENKVKLILNTPNLDSKLGKYVSYLTTFDFTQNKYK